MYMFMRQTAILIDIGMWHEGMINKISCCFSYLHLCYLPIFTNLLAYLTFHMYGLMWEKYTVRNDITINSTLITHFVIAFAAIFLHHDFILTYTWVKHLLVSSLLYCQFFELMWFMWYKNWLFFSRVMNIDWINEIFWHYTEKHWSCDWCGKLDFRWILKL